MFSGFVAYQASAATLFTANQCFDVEVTHPQRAAAGFHVQHGLPSLSALYSACNMSHVHACLCVSMHEKHFMAQGASLLLLEGQQQQEV